MTARPYIEPVHYSVLGPLRVERATGPVEIRGAKERLLLARLVAASGRVVGTADLVDTLWGDAPPPSAGKSLQTFVVRLRNTLEPDRSGPPQVLVTEGAGYRLVLDPGQVDADRFVRLAALGSRALADGRPEAAAGTLDEALSLWRGTAYADFPDAGFAAAEARRLEELRLTAAEDRLSADLARDRAAAAVPGLEALTHEHPLRERGWELLVTALYRSGRQAEALGAYDRVRGLLADELGVDPGPQLRAVHARVLAHDPGLGRPAARPGVPPQLRPAAAPGLVGRDAELARLRRVWDAALRGTPATVVVRGPAGAGATALASALAAEIVRDGGRVEYVDADTEPPDLPSADRTPLLVVGDGCDPGVGATLVLRLAPRLAAVPEGADVLDLGPLGPDALREIVAAYLTGTEVDAVLADVAQASGGLPGHAHARAQELARQRARRVVEAAASMTGSSSADLAVARDELAEGVSRLRAGRLAQDVDPRVCPWRGLAAYGLEDARWFAGRDRLVAELVARLAGCRVLALVGASGSGKSSVLRAGLLAALAEDVLPGSAGWRTLVLRPGEHPMRELARVALGPGGTPDLLARLLDDRDGAGRVVIAVDQFEETWTLCADEAERRQFLDTLTELTTEPDSPVTLVLAVRADRVGDLAEHAELRGLVGDGTVLVGPMTPAEVRRAVERPAAAAGLVLDDGLADTLVADAGEEPGLLPLLSTALAELWQRRDGRRLTYAAYVGLGGLDGAIAGLAEEAWGALTTPQQDLARRLLLRLAGPGEGSEVTRRRVPVAEAQSLAEGAGAVVDDLVAARLLTTSDGHVEVAHEALFREWPRLRGWLAEDAAGRTVQARLALAAAEWDAEDRDPALLWSGPRLASGLDVARARPGDLTAIEHAFLDTGREALDAERRSALERAGAAARQNRRLRLLLAGLAAVLVAAVAAGVLAWQARGKAEAASVSADAKRLAATALSQDYPDTALLAAVEATRLEDSPETYGSLLTLLARQPAVLHRVRTEHRFLRMLVSTDGGTVYASENDPWLWSLDSRTGARRWVRDVGGQVANLTTVRGSPDVVATVRTDPAPVLTRLRASDGAVVWSLPGQELVDVGLSEDPFPSWVVTAPGGRLLVETDSRVVEVDPDTGRPLRSWPWPADSRFSSESFVSWGDGRVSRALVGTTPARSAVVDTSGRGRTAHLDGRPLVVAPDGRTVLVTDDDETRSTMRLLDTRTLEEAGPRTQVDGYARAAVFSADGGTVFVGVDDSVLVLDGRLARTRTLEGHSGTVMDLGLADADTLWTAGRDGTVVAFDLSGRRTPVVTRPGGGATVGEAPERGGPAAGVRQAYDGPHTAWLLDATTGRAVSRVRMPRFPGRLVQPVAAAVTPDGRTAVFSLDFWTPGGDDGPDGPAPDRGALVLVDPQTRRVVRTVDLPWPAYALDTTPDGRRVVLNAFGGVAVVDLGTGDVGPLVPRPDRVYGELVPNLAVSPDGRAAVVGRPGGVSVVDLGTLQVRAERRLGDAPELPVGSVAWSADGSRVVVGDFAGWLHVLDSTDLTDAAPRRLVTGGFVIGTRVGSHGRVLATTGTDGDLTLWDTRTWRPFGSPVSDDHGWGLLSVPDDGAVARVLHEDGTTVEVSTDPAAWLRAACTAAGRDLTSDEAAVLTPGRPPSTTCSDLR
ncbi:nSTAND1 domain-containing NTPase [Phycicoccus flavus]|uniref:AAA family ATPase n=2 Tax=Phycicoccus flavus TaxID=2502783 RepID=A0A8T6R4Y3_9MICO|nr:BTAD domain-containing putative transcriptional regulator [Phycicoccus flavus]NHA69488.1 AAA family ATPase [Phycicoccus flavus]